MGKLTKNDNLFAEIILKAHTEHDAIATEQVKVAVQAFMNKPTSLLQKKIQAIQKKIQAEGVSTDFAVLTSDAFNVIIEEDNFDLAWEKSFRQVALGKGRDNWQIYNVENGIGFVLIEEGGRIDVKKMEGTVITAYVDYYGGAIGWTDKMIRFRKVPAMIDIASAFRNKFWTNKANNHYALLSTAAALNLTAYQGVAADGQLQRDIQTINQAAFTLANRNKDKGYGDTATARLIMYANPLNRARINAALRATTKDTATAGRTGDIVEYPIDINYTFNTNIVAGTPILILPGQKIQKADAMMPTTFKNNPAKDILTLSEVQSVWAIYGATVGDSDQAQSMTLG